MTDPLLDRLEELESLAANGIRLNTASAERAFHEMEKLLAFAREEVCRHSPITEGPDKGFCEGCSFNSPCPTRKSLEEKFL